MDDLPALVLEYFPVWLRVLRSRERLLDLATDEVDGPPSEPDNKATMPEPFSGWRPIRAGIPWTISIASLVLWAQQKAQLPVPSSNTVWTILLGALPVFVALNGLEYDSFRRELGMKVRNRAKRRELLSQALVKLGPGRVSRKSSAMVLLGFLITSVSIVGYCWTVAPGPKLVSAEVTGATLGSLKKSGTIELTCEPTGQSLLRIRADQLRAPKSWECEDMHLSYQLPLVQWSLRFEDEKQQFSEPSGGWKLMNSQSVVYPTPSDEQPVIVVTGNSFTSELATEWGRLPPLLILRSSKCPSDESLVRIQINLRTYCRTPREGTPVAEVGTDEAVTFVASRGATP